jgi:hypothetical protein
MTARLHRWLALAGVCAMLCGDSGLRAQDENREYKIKAAFLYNFGLYVQWPKDAKFPDGEKFYIGVLGKDEVGPYLRKIAATKILQDKKIVVQHFEEVKDYKPCHILFVVGETAGEEESAAHRLKAVLKKIKNAPVLLVSEGKGLAQQGAMINFFIEDNLVKFEINPDAAKAAGLRISSQVLRLGKIVHAPKP